MNVLRILLTCTSALALTPALALAAGDVTVPFDGGVNTGGWTFGPPAQFPATGGNPGTWLSTSVDTFAPQARTTAAGTGFTGDYRAAGVVSVGVDVRVTSTQFPFARPLSLMLSNGACTVWIVGAAMVPQPAEGWKPIDFAVPAASTVLPAGWTFSGSCADGNAAWNAVITNVTEVRFFYGDPEFFFIFDIWNTGIDNPRVVADSPWSDLGFGLAGTTGLPNLVGEGPLTGGSAIAVKLTNARPNAAAFLFAATQAVNLPLLGGTLVPNPAPPGLVLPFVTTPAGKVLLAGTWPNGVPAGVNLYLQYWIDDPAAVFGAAASNAVVGVTP